MMKATLLVLALLVTHELGVKMAETCPTFDEIFGAIISGNKELLNFTLKKISATEPEKAALGKIQDCYVENGKESVFWDLMVMGSIKLSKECISDSIV